MNGVSLSWHHPSSMSVHGGAFSRVLNQPAAHMQPKVTTEQTFVSVQPQPISVLQALSSPSEIQKGGMITADQGAGLAMQSDVASQLTGAISHGIGYDSKTGHAIGGSPQYMGTKFGDALDRAYTAPDGDSIYNFSYGGVSLIPVRAPAGSMSGSPQEGSNHGGQKNKFFDWKAYYNARLFSRILLKAPLSDHHAGIKKNKSLALGKEGFGDISSIELKAFITSLKLGSPISGYLNPMHRNKSPILPSKPKKIREPKEDEESFWDFYGDME